MTIGGGQETILWLAPEPPSLFSGGAISLAHSIQGLAADHCVELLYLPSNLVTEKAPVMPLPDQVRAQVFVRDYNSKLLALLYGWLRHTPYKIMRSQSASLAECVASICSCRKITAVLVEHSYMAHCVRGLQLPKVLNMHNIESQLAENEARYERSPLMRALWKQEGRIWMTWEKWLVTEFDHITVITENDHQQLLNVVGPGWERKISVLERGVDCVPRVAQRTTGSEILFVGSMAYGPNIDAVKYFASDILPLVRRHVTQVKFTIVGANPPNEVAALAKIPGITITGFVDDVGPYYDRADLVVIPMRSGGGVKMKLLEALGRGMPIVTTAAGATGVGITHGQEALIADTAESFAQCCVDLLTDVPRQRRLGDQAFCYAQQHHSWRTTGEKLRMAIEKAKEHHALRHVDAKGTRPA